MAYWIFENDEVIGPLRAIEVLDRATRKTLVTFGQGWVPLKDHQDFAAVVSSDLPNALDNDASIQNASTHEGSHDAGAKGNRNSDTGTGSYWVWDPVTGQATGPFGHEIVSGLHDHGAFVSCGSEWVELRNHPAFQVPTRQHWFNGVPKQLVLGIGILSAVGIGLIIVFATTVGLAAFGLNSTTTSSGSKQTSAHASSDNLQSSNNYEASTHSQRQSPRKIPCERATQSSVMEMTALSNSQLRELEAYALDDQGALAVTIGWQPLQCANCCLLIAMYDENGVLINRFRTGLVVHVLGSDSMFRPGSKTLTYRVNKRDLDYVRYVTVGLLG